MRSILGLVCVLALIGCAPGGYVYVHPDYLGKEDAKQEIAEMDGEKLVAILPFGIFGHLPEEDRSTLIVENFILQLEQKKGLKVERPSEALDILEESNLYNRFLSLSGAENDAIKKSVLLELGRALETDFLIIGSVIARRDYEIGGFSKVYYGSTYLIEAEMWDMEKGLKVWKVEKSVNVNDPRMIEIKDAVAEIPLP